MDVRTKRLIEVFPFEEFFEDRGMKFKELILSMSSEYSRVVYIDGDTKEMEIYTSRNSLDVNFMKERDKKICEDLGRELLEFVKEQKGCSLRFYLNGKTSTYQGLPF